MASHMPDSAPGEATGAASLQPTGVRNAPAAPFAGGTNQLGMLSSMYGVQANSVHDMQAAALALSQTRNLHELSHARDALLRRELLSRLSQQQHQLSSALPALTPSATALDSLLALGRLQTVSPDQLSLALATAAHSSAPLGLPALQGLFPNATGLSSLAGPVPAASATANFFQQQELAQLALARMFGRPVAGAVTRESAISAALAANAGLRAAAGTRPPAASFGAAGRQQSDVTSSHSTMTASAQTASTKTNSSRKVVPVTLESDKDTLSEYQCLLREQILFFEANEEDIEATAQGRNKPIRLGQVGIQCRHCANLPPGYRPRGSVYFPAKLSGIYQAAQNMAINHFNDSCRSIPELTRASLMSLKEKKSFVIGGGKVYWANASHAVGVKETEDSGLAFTSED